MKEPKGFHQKKLKQVLKDQSNCSIIGAKIKLCYPYHLLLLLLLP